MEYDDDESPNGLRRIAGPDKLDRAIAKMRAFFEVREFDARRPNRQSFRAVRYRASSTSPAGPDRAGTFA